jgi:5,10-methylene-tetrahydrofolate dehydrogenase/methenyl tetrahydrofolate cyclohydrolase
MQRHPFVAVTTAYLVFLLLAGCAALGVPAADTFNKKAAAAVSSVNTGSQTVLTLLQAHKITPDESDKYIAALAETQNGIDFTRQLYKTKPQEAEDRLAATIAALNLLLAELEARK